MRPRFTSHLLTVLDWVFRLVVAAFFLLAAVPKLLEPMTFAKAIANYRLTMPLIGQGYIYPVAAFMPALESVGALGLIFNRSRRAASIVVGGLLLLFTVLVLQAMLRGLNIDCGCYGAGPVGQALAQKVGLDKILENVVMLGMCAFVWWKAKKE